MNEIDKILIKIGNALRKERQNSGLTLTKYAEYIKVPVKIIAKIEAGHQKPIRINLNNGKETGW